MGAVKPVSSGKTDVSVEIEKCRAGERRLHALATVLAPTSL